VVIVPWFLSTPLQASLLTAERVSQNIRPDSQKVSAVTTRVLPRNKFGHDEETTGKKRKKKSQSVFSNARRIVSETVRSCNAADALCGLRLFCGRECFYENN